MCFYLFSLSRSFFVYLYIVETVFAGAPWYKTSPVIGIKANPGQKKVSLAIYIVFVEIRREYMLHEYDCQ